MKLIWTAFWRWMPYRRGTKSERRLMELRFALGRRVRAMRRAQRLTQLDLARRMRCAQSTVSGVERGRRHVAMEYAVRALLALGASDEEVAAAFDPSDDPQVQTLLKRMNLPFTQPLPEPWESAPAPRPEQRAHEAAGQSRGHGSADLPGQRRV